MSSSSLDLFQGKGDFSLLPMRNFKIMAEFTGDLEGVSEAHPEKQHTGVVCFSLLKSLFKTFMVARYNNFPAPDAVMGVD